MTTDNWEAWVALAATLLATAVGQVMFKLHFRQRDYRYLVAAGPCFAIAPICSYIALRSLGIGLVYMSTALSMVLVVLLSNVWLNEQLNRDHYIAMVLIVAGVLMYAS